MVNLFSFIVAESLLVISVYGQTMDEARAQSFDNKSASAINYSLVKDTSQKFGNPAIFVSLVEWADRIITE